MELILAQIASGHTAYLNKSLSKWLLDDLILLMTELISVCMFCQCGCVYGSLSHCAADQKYCSFMEPRLVDAYVSALPAGGRHPLGPCITFIAELALGNETAFEAAVLSKFLDFVLLSASRKYPGFRREFDPDDDESFACAFAVLSAPPLELREFWNMTLEQYWPFEYPPSLEDVVLQINKTSPATWLLLEAHFLQHEAPNMLRLATPCKYPMHNGRSVADVTYPRLQHFSLSSVVPPFQLQVFLFCFVIFTAHLTWL